MTALEFRIRSYLQNLELNCQHPQTLDDVAAELQMSRSRLTRLVRQITGMSWLGYLTRARIKLACKLLESTHQPIILICFNCGYEDLSTFYRNFRRIKGMSPARYRKLKCPRLIPDTHQSIRSNT